MHPTNHFKIGLFILAGLAIFLAGLFAFGARSYFEKKGTFETYVWGDVEGLSVGSPVKLQGVNMGKVTRIGFTWHEYPDPDRGVVLVEFEIRKSRDPSRMGPDFEARLQNEVKKGLRVRVKNVSVTGTSFVSLEYLPPEENPEPPLRWRPRNPYIPSAASQFTQMLGAIEKTLRNIERVDFAKMSQSLDANLGLMENVLRRVEKVDVHGIGTNVQQLILSTRRTSDELEKFVHEARGTMGQMHLDRVGQNAETLLARLTESNDRLKTLLGQVDVEAANAVLQSTRDAIVQIQEFLADLKRYPSSYLLGDPPPPASAVRK